MPDGSSPTTDRRWPLCFFSPMHYEPGYAYPLVVWLHSDDSSEHELHHVMPHLSTRNYVAVAPRGGVDTPGERNSFLWSQRADQVAAASDAVQQAIERATRRFNVDASQVFLAGFGSGGEMALRLALASPLSYAGVVSINGPLPRGRNPLGQLKSVRRLPVMLVAGLESHCYPQERVCGDLRLLHSAGVKLQIVHLPAGDELTTSVLRTINGWMMQQICETKSICY